jgi:hypothetical protein
MTTSTDPILSAAIRVLVEHFVVGDREHDSAVLLEAFGALRSPIDYAVWGRAVRFALQEKHLASLKARKATLTARMPTRGDTR